MTGTLICNIDFLKNICIPLSFRESRAMVVHKKLPSEIGCVGCTQN